MTWAVVQILFDLGYDRVQGIGYSAEDDATLDATHADSAKMATLAGRCLFKAFGRVEFRKVCRKTALLAGAVDASANPALLCGTRDAWTNPDGKGFYHGDGDVKNGVTFVATSAPGSTGPSPFDDKQGAATQAAVTALLKLRAHVGYVSASKITAQRLPGAATVEAHTAEEASAVLAAVLKTVLPTKLKDLPRLNANGNKTKSSELCTEGCCPRKKAAGSDACAAHAHLQNCCSEDSCTATRVDGRGHCGTCCIRKGCKNKRGDGTTAYCDRCAAARNAVAKFFTTHTPAVQGHSRIRDIMVAYESGGGVVPSTQTQPQHGQGRTRALLHLLAECHSANLGKKFPTGCALPGPFPFPETPGLFHPITFTGVTVYDDSGNVIQGFSKETVTAKAPETSSGGGVTGGGAATSGGGASVATPAWKEYRVKTGKDKGKLYYQQGAGATTWKRPDCLCPPRPPPRPPPPPSQ